MDISPEHLERGTVIAGYRIEEAIGRGAMAVVYRAVQLNLQRSVALKVLTEELARDQEFVARFFNEARAAAAISHPNIIQAYDAGVAEGDIYYFAMEYVEGETLQTRIAREGRIEPQSALTIAMDIAAALQYGWEKQKLTHGDIKPENIMVNSSGETKLADFGLAKVAGHDYAGDGIMLTPLYAPPERIRGDLAQGDCRADIYSFGATLYHMLAGTPPFPGDDPTEVMRRHLEETVPPLRRRAPEVPTEVAEYVQRLLAKAPENRPPDWGDVVRSLKRLQIHCTRKAGHPVLHGAAHARLTAASAAERRRGPRVPFAAILLAGVLAAGVVGTAVYIYRQHAAPPSPQASVPGASALPVPATGSTGGDDWLRLKGELGGIRDPKLAIEMLEAFRTKHSDRLPDEFGWYLKRYQRHSKDGSAPGRKQPKPAVLARRVAAVSSSADGHQLSVAERKRILAEISALIEEKGLSPVQRQRLTAAKARLGEPESHSEPPKRVPEAERRISIPAPKAPEALFTDETREILEEDAYVMLLAGLARGTFTLQRPPDSASTGVTAWLAAHPDPSPRREMVLFLDRRVLPAANLFLSSLITRKTALAGKQLISRELGKRTIRDITDRGVKLAVVSQYGETARWVSWGALDSPSYLGYLGAIAFANPGASLAECRPYLAVLLLTGAGRQLEQVLGRFRAENDPEKKLWAALSSDMRRAAKQSQALVLWRRAREEYLLGARVGPYRVLQRLNQANVELLPWRKEQILAMFKACEAALPEKQAGSLVRKAREQLDVLPSEALSLAGVAYARYGLLDFPERESIDQIRAQALQLMAGQLGDPDSASQWRRLEPLVFSSPRRARAYFPGLNLILFGKLEHDHSMPVWMSTAGAVLHAGALIEAGDWNKAQFFLGKADVRSIGGLPPNLVCSARYTQALLADRFGGTQGDAAVRFLKQMSTVNRGKPPSVALAAAQVECAVLLRAFDLNPLPWPSWSELAEQGPPALVQRFALANLTWLVEAGRGKEAASLIAALCTNGNALQKSGFRATDIDMLSKVRQWIRNPEEAPLPKVAPGTNLAGHVGRLFLAVLGVAPNVRSEVRESLADAPLLPGPGKTLFDGDTWFNQCILRVDYALETKRARHALVIIQNALGEPSLNLTGFYPRLCALKAGVQVLSGNVGGARDTLQELQWSTACSRAEKDFFRVFDRSKNSDWPRSISPGTRPAFWFAWLNWTIAVGSTGNGADGSRWLKEMEKCPATATEKTLLRSLWAYRVDSGGRPPGKSVKITEPAPQ